jgi:predicted nucleic acid-binding protein
MKEYIVDACIIVAFLFQEKSFVDIEKILNAGFEGECKFIMSPVVIGEAYFSVRRKIPEAEVDNFFDDFAKNYNLEIVLENYADCIAAAKIKARGGLSYFDCFNLVLAKKYPKATILTLDTEYKKFAKEYKIEFL